MTIVLDDLERLARAATPGPRKAEKGNGYGWRLLYHGPTRYGKRWEGDSEWELLGQYDRANGVEQYAEADAAYMAGTDPGTILALIAELRAERAAVDKMREALEEIVRVRYGVDLTDSDEVQVEYWSKLAIEYKTIARLALASATPRTR